MTIPKEILIQIHILSNRNVLKGVYEILFERTNIAVRHEVDTVYGIWLASLLTIDNAIWNIKEPVSWTEELYLMFKKVFMNFRAIS